MSAPRVVGVLGVRPHGRGGGVHRARRVRGCGVRLEQREAARVRVPAELMGACLSEREVGIGCVHRTELV